MGGSKVNAGSALAAGGCCCVSHKLLSRPFPLFRRSVMSDSATPWTVAGSLEKTRMLGKIEGRRRG